MTDFSQVDSILNKYTNVSESLIPLFQDIQGLFGYLPQEILRYVADKASLPLAQLAGVATFYSQFCFTPPGKYEILVCLGTACHVNNGESMASIIAAETGLAEKEVSADGLFSWQRVACLGCCSLAPVMMINGQVYGNLTHKKISAIIRQLRKESAGGVKI